MKKHMVTLKVLVIIGLFAWSAPASSASKVLHRDFVSKSLGMKRNYWVYLPDGYEGKGPQRYPVIYALHGLGGNGFNFFKYGDLKSLLDKLIAAGKLRPVIVVSPNGGNGYWTNHRDASGRRGKRWGDYVARDLVVEIDRVYATQSNRKGRALVGVSMGGFGALSLTLQHPETFHAGISLSGALFPKPPSHRKVYWKAWGNPPNKAHWRRISPIALLKKLKAKSPLLPRLFIQCGDKDSLGFYEYATLAHKTLDKQGVEHVFRTAKGGKHNWETWEPEGRHWLLFLEEGWAERKAASP